jgi:hypothetical protein
MPELEEVIDLTIEHHPNGLLPIRHRLVPAREVNNRKSSEAKA